MNNSARSLMAAAALLLSGGALALDCNGRSYSKLNGEDCVKDVVIKVGIEDVCESKGYNQDCGGASAPRRWAYNKNEDVCDQGTVFHKFVSPGADHVCPIDAPRSRCQPYASGQVAGVYGRAKVCGLVGK